MVGDVETRLTDFLLSLRDDGWELVGAEEEEPATPNNGRPVFGERSVYYLAHQRREHFIADADEKKLKRRAMRYVELVKASTGLSHLKSDEVQRLKVFRDGAKLITVESEHCADKIAAALHDEMPWMDAASELVWQALRRFARDGDPGIRLPPMLLVGPPGIGKSSWARKLGELLSMPTTIAEATGEPASFSIVGSQHGWNNATPGRLLETILRTQVANPLIVVDEIEKAGTATSSTGRVYDLTNALLPLLERSSATRWSRPCFRVVFDLSWVGWVMTANSTDGLSGPFLSRMLPPPDRAAKVTGGEKDFVPGPAPAWSPAMAARSCAPG